MSELIKELDEQIDIDKEMIEVLPKKGVKQIRELKKTLEQMMQKYEIINNYAIEEMDNRYNTINSIETNPEIAIIGANILKLDNLALSETGQTSFERMQLDKLTYKINGYYKKNLEIINQDIITCINRFAEVGIKLTGKDFQISEYANEYITVLLEEAENGNINSDRVKETFEKVYWKSSDLIVHILVNIRQLYDVNETIIDKYYKNATEGTLKALKVKEEKEVKVKKYELIKRLNDLKSVDGRIILDSFLNNVYNVGDYRTDSYTTIYENLISKKIVELSQEEKIAMDTNFKKLNNNLYEYANYLEFKFIIDELLNLKKIREKEDVVLAGKKESQDKKGKKKTKTLTTSEIVRNDINRLFTEIKKINDEISQEKSSKKGIFFFFKKKKKILPQNKTELILARDNKVLELKELYFKLDDNKLKDKVIENVQDTSKIYDVFKIASYNYGFLARTIIKQFKDIVEEDIDKMIEKFINFIRLYHFSVLNNVNIFEKKEIAVVIKDKHKLLGLEISKENFLENNLDDFAKQIKIIDYYNDIEKSNIKLEDIQFIINSRAILKK